MGSKKKDIELEKFRKFVDSHVPGGASHFSDTDLRNLRNLVDTSQHPEVAQGLIRELDTLLESDDKALEKWMAVSAATGIKFDRPADARAWFRLFRAFLAGNLSGD